MMQALEGRGVRFRALGDKLEIDRPFGALTKYEIRSLAKHKAQILAQVRGRASSEDHIRAVGAMRLSDFERDSLLVTVRSELLGGTVYFASGEKQARGLDRGLVYLPYELRIVAELDADTWHRVHNLKRSCHGVLDPCAIRFAEYDSLITRELKAAALIGDPGISEAKRQTRWREHGPAYEALLDRIAELTGEITDILGREMTPQELRDGFGDQGCGSVA